MAQSFFPVLSHFENGNPWTASAGRLRCRVVPGEEGLTAEVWEGPWAYEFSQVEETRVFPLTQEGLDALPAWLDQWEETVNSRPKRSLAEDMARRDAAQNARAAE